MAGTYGLEKQASLLLVKHLGVHLQCVFAEGEEFTLVREEDRCWRLLVIAVVTRVEHFDSGLLVCLSHR